MSKENGKTELRILDAINSGNISLSWQSRHSLQTGAAIGVEVFSRIELDSSRVIPPQVFIPVLEKHDQLKNFGLQVFTLALQTFHPVFSDHPELILTVNSSAGFLADENLLQEINALCSQYNVPAGNVAFDVSHQSLSTCISNLEEVSAIKQFADSGFQIAVELNDLGADIKALMEVFPIAEIKIARAIISNSIDVYHDLSSIKRIIYQAATSGIRVTAVGIENEEEYNLFKDTGFESAQGFYFSNPMALEEIVSSILVEYAPHPAANDRPKLHVLTSNLAETEKLFRPFGERFDLRIIEQGDDALDYLAEHVPDVLCVDVEQIEDTTLQTISKYQDDIRYIFMMGPALTEEQKLEVFVAGVNDYLSKPVSIIEIFRKTDSICQSVAESAHCKERLTEVQNLAYQAMNDSNSYAQMVSFMKSVSTANHEKQIANALFTYLETQDLRSSICFQYDGEMTIYRSDNEPVSTIEADAYKLLSTASRLYEFGNRIIVNDGHVSFLVKNLPTDVDKRGQVRDHVAVISECMEARYLALLQQRQIELVAQEISEISMKAANEVENSQRQKKELLDHISLEISMSFHKLDLSMDQEDYLTDMVKRTVVEHTNDNSGNEYIIEKLTESARHLESLKAPEPEEEDNLADTDSDVELF